MSFILFLYHVVSIYSIISGLYHMYIRKKYEVLLLFTGLRESEVIISKIKFGIGAIYLLYWIYIIFIG